jgi:hypothetical protein
LREEEERESATMIMFQKKQRRTNVSRFLVFALTGVLSFTWNAFVHGQEEPKLIVRPRENTDQIEVNLQQANARAFMNTNVLLNSNDNNNNNNNNIIVVKPREIGSPMIESRTSVN